MGQSNIREYDEFMLNNRRKVNGYMNLVLWHFVLTGPAIALGIHAGIFPYVTYVTCLYISIMVIGLSSLHLIMMRRIPHSLASSVFALTALDLLLFYMFLSDVSIRLTWFLVPVLSLLFCDRIIYYYAVILNFITMFGATYITSFYEAAQTGSYPVSTMAFFLDSIGGLIIESFVMFIAGCIIQRLTSEYYKELITKNSIIEAQKKEMIEKVVLLDSIVKIFDNANLIDFTTFTENPLKGPEKKPIHIDVDQTHTTLNMKLQEYIIPEQHEFFMNFTNLHTLRERLASKNIISEDFIHSEIGWIRAQYITVAADSDGVPTVVIYVTRNVDADKRREAALLKISMTDELTNLYNRRRYNKDVLAIKETDLPEDLVIFSMDVNDLKTVNDTKGHYVGDELIKGAAYCLTTSVGTTGIVYRTGGDEFIAIVHTENPEEIRKNIAETSCEWKGSYIDKLNISVGYAAYTDHPEMSFDDLQILSDEEMYAEKDRYYRENHIDRRRRRRSG
ncbi:diguanylate cyclase (GGDEF) domain-containing protein [Lachnospiraceae bacterium JC7]|nr:diguanylate cyclase (GGDEF) domain-containing protein [Lachnospiraceae bacterium JC7]